MYATRDIEQTLANVRHMLAPRGLLILLEGIQPTRWADLTFGLLEGWWRFEDQHRPSYPLLTSAQWQTLLNESNFCESLVVGEQQAVILGRADATRPVYPYATPMPWLIFTKEKDSLGATVRQSLEAMGESVLTVDSQSHNELQSLFEQFALKETGLKGILYLWGRMAEIGERTLTRSNKLNSRSVEIY